MEFSSNIDIKNNISILESLINKLSNNVVDIKNVRNLCDMGIYYYNNKNYLLMKLYFVLAIEYGCMESAYNLAFYYQEVEKKYHYMKAYYEFAITKGDIYAMYKLAYHYYVREKNVILMKKYFNMAISFGDTNSMYELGMYYKYCEQNYLKAEGYFFLAFAKGHECAGNEITWKLTI